MWTCPKCKESIEDQFDTCWKCAGASPGPTPARPASDTPASPTTDTAGDGAGSAFIKGGCGCLVVFFVLAFFAVLVGGHAHADAGGLIFLFIIGGVIGLIVFFIYNQGRKDATGGGEQSKKEDRPDA